MNTGHYRRIDDRINVLRKIISPFQDQLNEMRKINKEEDFLYWDSVYADDMEHIVGTVFIVLQNYINSSIHDLYPKLKQIHEKYSIDEKIDNSNISRIELIIAIANFYKHRDSPSELRKNTIKPFDNLNIPTKVIYGLGNEDFFHKTGSDSPVYQGFNFLSEYWDFNELINIVTKWRENLWIQEELK
ncbi:hypothetical protein [Flavobacterium sp. 140616W15]|uniref:hypothetical protein n=1 Tax=Flavobacterium sp. 140616W15 TaxID=2478552 RepID=UPI000F0C53CC|nr:hypothetical protein [Flavobacterium sp. 140616W15]AYN05446.1 hypothetical protein EAG11_15795 [Flavobacterium sp. 140616W15]